MASEVVLFDLGGVIIELAGVPVLAEWAGGISEDEVWRRWLACPWVRRFERGQCTTEEFGDGLIEEWNLSLARDEFLEAFRTWPSGLYPGARELVESLRGRVLRACFSNTNAFHWADQFQRFELDGLLDRSFLSFEMGLVKPDLEAFEHVIEALGCPPERILFLDDNQINVDGARRAGLDAERVVGPQAARSALATRGLA